MSAIIFKSLKYKSIYKLFISELVVDAPGFRRQTAVRVERGDVSTPGNEGHLQRAALHRLHRHRSHEIRETLLLGLEGSNSSSREDHREEKQNHHGRFEPHGQRPLDLGAWEIANRETLGAPQLNRKWHR